MIDLDLSRYDSIATRFAVAAQESTSFLKSGIETRNPAFNRMIDEIEQVASRSKAPILLTGPTGAGKSQLARRIYELKRLKHQIAGPFVEVNCATLKGDGAMSALFGHRRGAFTGAVADRPGLRRAADKGMLFLDEIGELGVDEQAMILRAIEDKRFLPVGSDTEAASDFQLIAGTNRDLGRAVAAGGFRDDLYARLNLWNFRLPGLAERREDIEPNLDYELDRHAERGGNRVNFNKEARHRYLSFATGPDAHWQGNFRDLAASVTRMATLSPKGRIDTDIVQAALHRLGRLWSGRDQNEEDILAEVLTPAAIAEIDPSTVCSSPQWWIPAAGAVRFPRPGGRFSPHPGHAEHPPMMPIACESIWRGLRWIGPPSPDADPGFRGLHTMHATSARMRWKPNFPLI